MITDPRCDCSKCFKRINMYKMVKLNDQLVCVKCYKLKMEMVK